LFNDTTLNGITDILKRSESGQKLLQEGMSESNNFQVVEFAGVKFVQSTNVPLTSGVPTTGKSAYSTYIAAKDAVFSIKLGKADVPEGRNFKAEIKQFAPSVADPAGLIGGAVAYNFKYVAAPRPATTQAFRRIQSESAIS
jgi:hypothetical protein